MALAMYGIKYANGTFPVASLFSVLKITSCISASVGQQPIKSKLPIFVLWQIKKSEYYHPYSREQITRENSTPNENFKIFSKHFKYLERQEYECLSITPIHGILLHLVTNSIRY